MKDIKLKYLWQLYWILFILIVPTLLCLETRGYGMIIFLVQTATALNINMIQKRKHICTKRDKHGD